MTDKRVLSWGDLEADSLQLASMIEDHCRKTGEHFDKLLVIPRGAYIPAAVISRKLGFEAPDILHACITSYQAGKTKRQQHILFGQMPDKADVRDKNILIIEEVCDSGHTLAALDKWLKDAGAALIKTGVLHYKPTASKTGYKPDWHVSETTQWLVYPTEAYEISSKASIVRGHTAETAAPAYTKTAN